MTAWPPENTEPTAESPWFCDGNYGPEAFRVSPEGNVYGQMHWVADTDHKIWWTGSKYQYVESTCLWMSETELPTTGDLFFGRIDKVREFVDGQYVWSEFWWDAENEQWQRLRWLNPILGIRKVRYPGEFVGAAHVVTEPHVLHFWNGYEFDRPAHSMLRQDEPERHLPPGFVESLVADVELRFVTAKQLALMPVSGGSGKAWVRNEWIAAGSNTSVYNRLASLEWNSQDNVIAPALLEPDTEYYVYQAGTTDSAFVIEGLAGDGSHNAAPAWDYRGRLFLSRSAPQGQYLSRVGSGRNARLAGKIQTDSTSASSGGPFFLRELNISKISNRSSLPEALREASDYVLEFTDHDTLTLTQIDGTYGQMAVASQLYYLGTDYEVSRFDGSIEWDDNVDGKLVRRTANPVSNSQYYVYMAGNIDGFNFNAVNVNTSRPWDDEDEGSEGNYDPDKDFRLRPFISLKAPDHERMSEQHPGFYTRHIGQISTDGNGRFVNAADVSAIRQPTLNPTRFDGLAEISFVQLNDTEFAITKRAGSSGVITVAGEGVHTHEITNSLVHTVRTTDILQEYTEGNLNAPLSGLAALSTYANTTVHVYMANSRQLWGAFAGRTFCTLTNPVNGYLSRNWPGSQARWVGAITMDDLGKLSPTFLSDSVTIQQTNINDNAIGTSSVWSSAKVKAELDRIYALIADQGTMFDSEKVTGLSLILEYYDATHLRLRSVTGGDVSVVFPNLAARTIASDGILLDVAGAPATIYYIYLKSDGTLYASTDAPEISYAKLDIKGNDILVGYMGCSDTDQIAGSWNVYSSWNQSLRSWLMSCDFHHPEYQNVGGPTTLTFELSVPGLVVPPGIEAFLSRGYFGGVLAWFKDFSGDYLTVDIDRFGWTTSYNGVVLLKAWCPQLGDFTDQGYPDYLFDPGVYPEIKLIVEVYDQLGYNTPCGIYDVNGGLALYRYGNVD